ncbi:hypothetical protein [Frankia sp. Cas3]|uniref:hypothetical protein n=1 Tax=Frankia sp. Cas3 TaxID=3073926 RepID=UPI002AD4B241|nr:hypothetical protein [Frankia sp. Cas3]
MRYVDPEFAPTVRAQARPSKVSPAPVGGLGLLALQSTVGNRAMTSLLTTLQPQVQRQWSSSSSDEDRGQNTGQDAAQNGEQDGGQDVDRDIHDAGAIAGVDTQPDDAGADTGSGEERAAAPPSGQIDVRATKIRGLAGLPVYHLFVIYIDASGTPYFFRGGPSGRGGPGGYGAIKCDHGPYTPGTIDWEPGAPSTTVMAGPAAHGKDASFTRELSRIDAAAIPYQPTGPNSNSVARTILNKSGVPENKPVMIAPGWGQIL